MLPLLCAIIILLSAWKGHASTALTINYAFPVIPLMVFRCHLKWSDYELGILVAKYAVVLKQSLRESSMPRSLHLHKSADKNEILTELENSINQSAFIQFSLSTIGKTVRPAKIIKDRRSPFDHAILHIKFMQRQAIWLDEMVSKVEFSQFARSSTMFSLNKTIGDEMMRSVDLIGKYLCENEEQARVIMNVFDESYHLFYRAKIRGLIVDLVNVRNEWLRMYTEKTGIESHAVGMFQETTYIIPLEHIYKREEYLLESVKQKCNRYDYRSVTTQMLDNIEDIYTVCEKQITDVVIAKKRVQEATTYSHLLLHYRDSPHPLLLGHFNATSLAVNSLHLQAQLKGTKSSRLSDQVLGSRELQRFPKRCTIYVSIVNHLYPRFNRPTFPIPRFFTDFIKNRIAPRLPVIEALNLRFSLAKLTESLMFYEISVHESFELALHECNAVKPTKYFSFIYTALHQLANGFSRTNSIHCRYFASSLIHFTTSKIRLENKKAAVRDRHYVNGFEEDGEQLPSERFFEALCLHLLALSDKSTL